MEGQAGIRYQPALDGVRAFAVAAVIAYHFGAGWATGGFLGVDAFFVLSGYLITTLLLAELRRGSHISLPSFWARRARRLLPALLVVLAAVALYAAVLAPASQLGSLRGDGFASLFYFANWHFVLSGQSYFDLFSLPSPMRHLWSLAIEEQFYLVWPLIVLVCLRVGHGSRKVLAGVCVAGIATSVAIMAMLYEPGDPSRAYYGTDARAHTLLVGAVLALVLLRRRPERRGSVLALHTAGLVAAGACLAALVTVSDQGSGLYHGGSLLFAVAVAVVIASAVQPTRRSVWSPLRAVLSLGVLRWIGLISYGLYLWHWPATVVLTETRTGLSGAALAGVRLAVTVLAATLSFYLVEQPIRRGALRGRRGRVAVPTAFATVGAIIVVATVGATATPLQSVQIGQRIPSKPMPVDATAQRGVDAATSPSAPRVLLVGDSIPYTLLPGLEPAAARRGVPLDTALVAGCGVVSGVATYFDGKVPAQAPGCDKIVTQYENEKLTADRPDIVVWMSMWEVNDRIVNGELVKFGTDAWDTMMLAKIDEAVSRLTSTGAHLVITTVASRASSDYAPSNPSEDARYVHLNALYRHYGRMHPGSVSILDFAASVCPGGPPCARDVDGIEIRPLDGTHFTPKTARWAATRLLDPVLECRPLATGWQCPERTSDASEGRSARK
ncbi:MAG TPA: acyltransferase family protein [Acidimicrobiia bacterium]|nr:acyltransferase family protein [Acidimicrobiia bacterium]